LKAKEVNSIKVGDILTTLNDRYCSDWKNPFNSKKQKYSHKGTLIRKVKSIEKVAGTEDIWEIKTSRDLKAPQFLKSLNFDLKTFLPDQRNNKPSFSSSSFTSSFDKKDDTSIHS